MFHVDGVWLNLGNVSNPEGECADPECKCHDKNLEECKVMCSLNPNCNSFSFSELGSKCCLKDICIFPSHPTKPVGPDYTTYYKDCGKIINIFDVYSFLNLLL